MSVHPAETKRIRGEDPHGNGGSNLPATPHQSDDEDDYWVAVPRTEEAWSSRFGTLRGISSVDQGRRLELLPYAAGSSRLSANQDSRNPFVDDLNLKANAGADLKMGLGSNLTLDATFFPDFGQVEVDPAVINLTDTETFYPERRPFFTEGSALFGLGLPSSL